MDGPNGYQNPLQLMLMNFGGNVNDDSYVPQPEEITSNRGGQEEYQANALLPLTHWSETHKTTPLNYYEFLTENSSLLDKAPAHVLESISPPVADSQFIQGMPRMQSELFYNYPGVAYGSKPVDSFLDVDTWKLYPQTYSESTLNLRYNEEDRVNKLKSSQIQSQAQSHMLWTQEPNEGVGNVSRGCRRANVAPSVFLSDTDRHASRQRAISTDRKRRERIAERIKALQELLPHSAGGSQASVMDEIINHVKYLQFQMNELSRSRLRGDLCSGPSIFFEGHHHYILHEQTMNEPLEETMTKMLEVNPSVATNFLESKGLVVMPMALADWLKQAT